MSATLDWARDGADWPNAESSRFVDAGGLRWHVQRAGAGPVLLMLHGTGASVHSWRDLLPRLQVHYDVIAPDLPGHGFTGQPRARGLSLPGMAGAVGALLDHLGVEPAYVVGHSAGAAILARLCLDRAPRPARLVALNGALLPFDGLAAWLFPSLARLLFVNPLAPRAFALGARDRRRVARLIRDNGSRVDDRGVDLYARLLQSPPHVGAALGMMARWELRPLVRELPDLATDLVLVAGELDRAVPPAHADRVARMVPGARVMHLPGLGHLAHEEAPDRVAELLLELGPLGDASVNRNAARATSR